MYEKLRKEIVDYKAQIENLLTEINNDYKSGKLTEDEFKMGDFRYNGYIGGLEATLSMIYTLEEKEDKILKRSK